LLASLAIAPGDNQKYTESWETFQEAIDLYTEHYHAGSPETLMLVSAAAIVAWRMGHHSEASGLADMIFDRLTER